LVKLLQVDYVASPLGQLVLVVDQGRLCALDYADCEERMMRLLERRYGPVDLSPAHDQQGFSGRVRAYFDGDYGALEDIAVAASGTTFQEQVWAELRLIPPGSVRSYGEVAARMRRSCAYRAVGAANALNPVTIVLPCHRLVGANASLRGYSGGLERKQWLLEHEGANIGGNMFPDPA